MLFNITELNFLVLQTLQASLRTDYENTLINFSLDRGVASMIIDMDTQTLRSIMSRKQESIITLTHQKDKVFWNELTNAVKGNIDNLAPVTDIRAFMTKIASAS